MRNNRISDKRKPAPELSHSEIEKTLKKVGKLIKTKRKGQTSLESFSYEINISRSAMARYEAGGDMLLSSFFKVLHGLGINQEDFFKEIK